MSLSQGAEALPVPPVPVAPFVGHIALSFTLTSSNIALKLIDIRLCIGQFLRVPGIKQRNVTLALLQCLQCPLYPDLVHH